MTDTVTVNASRGQILRATGWALLGAAVLVVGVVLPAEYGIDLTGFGKLTGLTALSNNKSRAAAAAMGAAADPGVAVGGKAQPLSVWAISHPDKYQTQSFEVPLKGDEELEYKAFLSRGEPLLYSWHVKEGSQVYFEFHGQPTEGKWPEDYYESYEKGEGSGGQGSMVAPFTGQHGWYWLNLSGKPVTIIVELTGYFRGFGPFADPPP